jgi:hypothetical protein
MTGIDWGMLRRLAERQADLLTRAQCRAAGLSDSALKWRVDSGRWMRCHEGVFLVRPGRDDFLARATAALLRVDDAGPAARAALAGRSAAYLWGLERRAPATVELVVPKDRSVTAPGRTTVRRSARWDDLVDDRAYPWRTTKVATVLDVAARCGATEALAVVSGAVQRELVTASELSQELARRRGHPHGRLLGDVLADCAEGAESAAELLYVRDVERAHGLPSATRQLSSDAGRRRRHDNGYLDFRLLVEVDGRLGHETWADRVRDAARDRQVLGHELATVRVHWADVALTPCRTAVEVGAVLRLRGWSGEARVCRRRDCVVRQVA